MDDFVDIAEASARLGGFPRRDLIRACENGEVPARHVGGEWLIQSKWLAELEARLNATVAQTIASGTSPRPAMEPRVQSLEERRRRKAAGHFMRLISQQLAELRAEVTRIEHRLAALDMRTRPGPQPRIGYDDEASSLTDRASPLRRKPPGETDCPRLE